MYIQVVIPVCEWLTQRRVRGRTAPLSTYCIGRSAPTKEHSFALPSLAARNPYLHLSGTPWPTHYATTASIYSPVPSKPAFLTANPLPKEEPPKDGSPQASTLLSIPALYSHRLTIPQASPPPAYQGAYNNPGAFHPNSPPPQGDYYQGGQGYYPPQQNYGYPPQQQGYYGPPPGQQMYYPPQQGHPQQGYYADGRGRDSAGGGGICAGIMAALACCCCLDFIF